MVAVTTLGGTVGPTTGRPWSGGSSRGMGQPTRGRLSPSASSSWRLQGQRFAGTTNSAGTRCTSPPLSHSRHVKDARRLSPTLVNPLKLLPEPIPATRVVKTSGVLLNEAIRVRTATAAVQDFQATKLVSSSTNDTTSPTESLKLKGAKEDEQVRWFKGLALLLSASHRSYDDLLLPLLQEQLAAQKEEQRQHAEALARKRQHKVPSDHPSDRLPLQPARVNTQQQQQKQKPKQQQQQSQWAKGGICARALSFDPPPATANNNNNNTPAKLQGRPARALVFEPPATNEAQAPAKRQPADTRPATHRQLKTKFQAPHPVTPRSAVSDKRLSQRHQALKTLATEDMKIRIGATLVDSCLRAGFAAVATRAAAGVVSDHQFLDGLVEASDHGINDEALEVLVTTRGSADKAARPRPAIRMAVRRDLFSTVREEVAVVRARVPTTDTTTGNDAVASPTPRLLGPPEFAPASAVVLQASVGSAFCLFRPTHPTPPFRSAWRARSYPPPRRMSRRGPSSSHILPPLADDGTAPDEHVSRAADSTNGRASRGVTSTTPSRVTRQILLQRLGERGRNVTFVPVEPLGIPDRTDDCTPD